MVELCRQEDPPPAPQLVVQVTIAERMYEWGQSKGSPRITRAVGQLGFTSFYYLLRVGEYTKPRWTKKQTRRKFVGLLR